MENIKYTKPYTAAEFEKLDTYTRSVWKETHTNRLAYYRKNTTYTYAYCSGMAARDADLAARTYNATGERIEFEG